MLPAISVIIPAKNAQNTLDDCLKAVMSQDNFRIEKDYEIIVVDDGSTDDTRKIAERVGVYVISQENKGPASARNSGVNLARGEIIAFTDADCIPARDWLVKLTSVFSDPQVAGVRGVYATTEKKIISRFVQAEYAFKYERTKKYKVIDFIDTYSAAYRRQIFVDNAGFNEIFPVPSVEDQELSFRLSTKGFKLVFKPDAIVYHQHDATIWEYIHRKYLIGYWKAIMLKWMPKKVYGDSHTPLSQRFEILFFTGIIFSIFLTFIQPEWGMVLIVLGAFFILSITPFLSFILRYDPLLAAVILPLVCCRAGSLATGLLVGILSSVKASD
jgi:glycosyltransferase involved in cell wall biosynthesis